ncbi:MAG: hypothetical protein LBV71_17775 [Prevotella sp.]|jgi:hypothetical protein|nr:hypothetical protein [Prevotella sp.]
MGDCNTLHLFDSKKFHNIIVPDLMGEGRILQHYFNSCLGKSILWDNVTNRGHRIENILKLCRDFDAGFKIHSIYKHATNQDTFVNIHIQAIEDLSRIIQLIVFSECALFTPHFRLGKRLLSYFVDFDKMDYKSVALKYLEALRFPESGSLHAYLGNGMVNWLTDNEVKLLLANYGDIIPQETEEYAASYISELRIFLEIAAKNDLGVVTMVNLSEIVLDLITASPIKLAIPWEEYNLDNLTYHK